MKTSILHRNIFEALRTRILRGDYGPSGKLPTESDLTKEFKVSRITVMRAMHDLQQDDLIWRKQGAGSFVKEVKNDRLRLGIMIPGLLPTADVESVFPVLQHHLVREAAKLGWQALLGNSEMSGEADPSTCAPVEVARRLVAHGVQAVSFTPLGIDGRWDALNRNVLAEFKAANVPVVLLGRDIVEYPERSEWDLVSMDDINAGYLVGKHLLAQGCRRIVFAASSVHFPQVRLVGLRLAVPEVEVVCWDHHRLAHVSQIKKMIRRNRCQGIVCDNDISAAPLMHSLLAAGVRIPEQVRMISFDNAPIARLLPVPLSSFAQPTAGLARAALSALIGRKRDPLLSPRFIQLEGHLVVRKSSHL